MDSWPRNRLEPPIAATLKKCPEDFIVRETLAFLPSGEGEHCYVQLEKSGLSTPELAGRLADLHGLAGQDVGYAGMKDKHAVTSQWFSLRGVATLSGAVRELDGVSVLEESRHAQKLRRGQICENRFEILLRELGPGNLDSALDRLATEGAPQLFRVSAIWLGQCAAGHELARPQAQLTRLPVPTRSLPVCAQELSFQ